MPKWLPTLRPIQHTVCESSVCCYCLHSSTSLFTIITRPESW